MPSLYDELSSWWPLLSAPADYEEETAFYARALASGCARPPDPADTTYLADYAFLLRGPGEEVRVVHDRHVEGLFPRAEWLRLLSEAGFVPRVVPFEHSELETGAHEVFVAARPDRR